MVLRAVIEGGGASTTLTADVPPVTPTSGAPLYGPGGYWPARTPAWDSAATTTVSSLSALNNAIGSLATTTGDVTIHLADGAYSGVINEVSAMASRSSNILVRPANPDGCAFNVDNRCSSITLAGFVGSWYLRGAANVAIARWASPINAGHFINGTQGVQIVEWVARRQGEAATDRLQVKGDSGVAPKNILMRGNWTECILRPAGSTHHTDLMQSMAATGFWDVEHCYFGHGAKATILSQWEMQGSQPYPTITYDTVWVGRVDQPPGNDLRFQMQTGLSVVLEHVRSDGTIYFESPERGTISMVDVRANKLSGTSAPPSYGYIQDATITRPAWQAPAWWSTLRQAA